MNACRLVTDNFVQQWLEQAGAAHRADEERSIYHPAVAEALATGAAPGKLALIGISRIMDVAP
jgi:hypothetical protein